MNEIRSLTNWYSAKVRPLNSGLPNFWVIFLPPIIALFTTTLLIAFQLSGTSSGVTWQAFQETIDPRLISGEPRGIRSDEWLVQQAWVISQFMNGFPASSPHFPSGMDMTVFNDLPVWEWSTLFRPHVWGYLVFGLDTGVAWYWWVPALALFVFLYLFLISLIPNRPITATLIASSTLASPFIQWWYQPTTIWSIAWIFLALASISWTLRTHSIRFKILWATLFSYFSITLALEIYVPFIVPSILIVAICGVGLIMSNEVANNSKNRPFWEKCRTLLPMLLGALFALGVITLWAVTRVSTIKAILNTAYPGQRTILTGSGLLDPSSRFVSLFGAPWSSTFKYAGSGPFGPNASEASSAFPVAILLLPALLLITVMTISKFRKIEWFSISVIVATVLFLCFLYLPGWDLLAKYLGLYLVPTARAKIAFVSLMPLSIVAILVLTNKRMAVNRWLLSLITLISAAVVFLPLVIALKSKPEIWNTLDKSWIPALTLLALSCVFLYFKKLITVSMALLLACTLFATWGTNPLYKGVYNLNSSNIGRTVSSINSKDPGIWIGVGSWVSAQILTEVPVTSLSGVQTYPVEGIWAALDPSGKYETEWNRLGHTRFSVKKGPVEISNPQPDVISVSFDPCRMSSRFSGTVYILSELELESDCLALDSETNEPKLHFWIYQIN